MALNDTDKQRIREQFAARVKELRTATGQSQDKFALEHGQHRTWVGHLERAERVPTLYGLVDLARAFDITVAELVEGIDADH